MIEVSTLIIMASFVAVLIAWAAPPPFAFDAVAAWTLGVMAALSPPSAAGLLVASILSPAVFRLGERWGRKGLVAAFWIGLIAAAFVAARLPGGPAFIGVAFFTLRLVHVTVDWWTGRLPAPTLRQHLRYQFFLPVMFIGPIHRFQNFERQTLRRRRHFPDVLNGLERVLVGFFMAAVIGRYLTGRVTTYIMLWLEDQPAFLRAWTQSAIDWSRLYFEFAGLTAVALGLSLMMGLKLEENFDRPWQARNLTDFWTRWHISLTSWCRDYIFTPVSALTRNAVLGLAAGMLAMGLWHEISLYYVLWAFWQALGVLLDRLISHRLPHHRLPWIVRRVGAPVLILAWLSLAKPVITFLLPSLS